MARDHAESVNQISGVVREAFNKQERLYIFHGSSNTTREVDFKNRKNVDLTRLDNILEINEKEKYAVVEPNVSMEKLLSATLKYDLMPPVIMEFPAITVGGAIQGGAAESSSFKYGLFHNCCEEYEVVLGNGEVKVISPTKDADLFWGLAGSYGSLAIITKVKLRLIQAKKYVSLNYIFFNNVEEGIKIFQQQRDGKEAEFLDAIMFGKHEGVVMVGKVVDEATDPILTFSHPGDDWFYLHVKEKITEKDFGTDTLPIAEYLFRYDRGAFWGGKSFFTYFKIPFLKLTRRMFDFLLHAKDLYRILHATNKTQIFVVQDFCLPHNHVAQFLDDVQKILPVYPLWFCPLASTLKEDRLSPNHLSADLVINVGVYAKFNKSYNSFVKINRDLEEKASSWGARKVLYAHQYYPNNEFWKIYDRPWYESLRDKYLTHNVFPDIYEKTIVTKRYQAHVLKGMWKIITS